MATPKQKLKAILRALPRKFSGNCVAVESDKLPASNFADDIVRLRHSGWFTSEFQDEKYRGEVWRLICDSEEYDIPFDVPSRAKRAPIYLAGYTEEGGYSVLSCSNGVLDTFDCPEDAARAADHLAERNAEEAREYSERWQEASNCADEIESAKQDAKGARENFRAFMDSARAGIHEASMRKLAATARIDHNEAIRTILANRERIAELDMQGEF
jgi:hypothetical protein